MIDWGNSYLKFIEIEDLTESNIINAKLSRITNLEELNKNLAKKYQNILISSVRADDENLELKQLIEDKSSNIYFASSKKLTCGISCAYENPASLGVDRWMGIIAAANSSDPVGIISIGTAITIDIVINKKHLGGHILPGRELMFKSLEMTGQVRAKPNETNQIAVKLGQTTNECVNFAIDTAIHSYLKKLICAMEEQNQINSWVVTGGGIEIIENLNTVKGIFNLRPMLVFEGMRNAYFDY